MIPADAATLAAERDAYRALYEQERADRLSDRCHQMGAEINVLAAQTAELRAENADLRSATPAGFARATFDANAPRARIAA